MIGERSGVTFDDTAQLRQHAQPRNIGTSSQIASSV